MEFKVLFLALLVSACSANNGWGSPAAVQQVQQKPSHGPVAQQQHQHNANCGHNQVQHHDRYQAQPVVQQAYSKPAVAPVQTNYVRPVVYQQQQQVYNKPVAPVQHNNVVYNRQPKAYNHAAPVQNHVQQQTYVQKPVVYQQQQQQVQKVHQPVVYQQAQQVRPVQQVQYQPQVQQVHHQPQVQRVQQVQQVHHHPQVQRVQQVQYQPHVQRVQQVQQVHHQPQVQRVQQVQYQPQVQRVQQVQYQPQVQRVQQVQQVHHQPQVQRVQQVQYQPQVQRPVAPVVHQTNYVQNNRQPKVYQAAPVVRAPVQHQQQQQTYYRPAAPVAQQHNVARAPVHQQSYAPNYAQNYRHQRDFQAHAPQQQVVYNNRPVHSQVYAGANQGSGINFQKSFNNPLFRGNFGFNAGRTYGGNFGYGGGSGWGSPAVGTVARGLKQAVSRFLPQIRLAKTIGNTRTTFNFPSFRINNERVHGRSGYGLDFSAAAGK